ncbi:MAG: class I SAM-dependent methyltransferase [Thermoleophilia bacterium]
MSLPGKIVESLMRRYPGQSTEVALRYLPVVRILRNAGASRVLEVGSGDLGLAPYSSHFELTGLDLSFDEENPDMRQITGSAARLPFEDREFDAVVSVDALEHIPKKDREPAVTEMLRCAHRLVVIAVPYGAGARAQDRYLDERYRRVRGEDFPFLKEHLEGGLPEAEDLERVIVRCLRGMGRSGGVVLHRNSNLWIRSLLMKGWISRNRFYYNLAVLGLMPFAGILSRMNWGRCYRIIAEVDIGG